MHKLILSLLITASLSFADGASPSQHAQVMGQIKSRVAKTEDQKLPAIGQVTATEYFLSQILAHGYENTIPGMVTAFFNEHPSTIITDFQKHQFAQMMEAERTYDGWYVFYHATLDEIGLFYDVISEYRARLAMRHSDDVAVLRALDDKFKDIPDVAEFMAMFEDKTGIISDHSTKNGTKYSELGLSVNPFLFGNYDNSGECSYRYWLDNRSIFPPNIMSAFHSFTQKIGLTIKWSDFKNLARPYRLENSRMLQIFINPKIIDHVGYASIDFGQKLTFKAGDHNSNSIKLLLDLLRRKKDPLLDANGNTIFLHNIQARLFLKPKFFHDPNMVRIIQYQSNPISPSLALEYKAKLRDLVDADLDQWLKSNIQSFSGVRKVNKLQHVYRSFEAAQHGQNRKLRNQDDSLYLDIYNLLDTGKLDEAIAFVRKHPELDYTKPLKFNVYIAPQSLTQKTELITPLSEKTLSLLRLMDKDFDTDNAWFWESLINNFRPQSIKFLIDSYQKGSLRLINKNIDVNPYQYALDLPVTNDSVVFIRSFINAKVPIPADVSKKKLLNILISKEFYDAAALLFANGQKIYDTAGALIEPYKYARTLQNSDDQAKFLRQLLNSNIPIPAYISRKTLFDMFISHKFYDAVAQLFTNGPKILDDTGLAIDPYKYALSLESQYNKENLISRLIFSNIPVPLPYRQDVWQVIMGNTKKYGLAIRLFKNGDQVLDKNGHPIELYAYALDTNDNIFISILMTSNISVPVPLREKVLKILTENKDHQTLALFFANGNQILDEHGNPITPDKYAETIQDQKKKESFLEYYKELSIHNPYKKGEKP